VGAGVISADIDVPDAQAPVLHRGVDIVEGYVQPPHGPPVDTPFPDAAETGQVPVRAAAAEPHAVLRGHGGQGGRQRVHLLRGGGAKHVGVGLQLAVHVKETEDTAVGITLQLVA